MNIQILSHRGYWKVAEEKNSQEAFARSFSLSFGTETDVRDMCGELVISHDPPLGTPITLEGMLNIYQTQDGTLPLALNIKADGLQEQLKETLQRNSVSNYFVFDMSIPDTIGYLTAGMSVFARQSEFEPTPAFYEKVRGIWLDAFVSDWFDQNDVAGHVRAGKKVCIVSPELHRRDHRALWEKLRRMSVLDSGQVMLCTDYPEEARTFFRG
jgi:hypothetical protein